MTDKIIERDFKQREQQGRWPIKLVEHDFSACEHPIAVVNERARTLTCEKCGVPLDPLDFISRLAKSDQQVHWERQRLEELKAQRRTHAIGHALRVDGSDSGTACGASGDCFYVTRKRMWVDCKRCRAKLGITSGSGTDQLL